MENSTIAWLVGGVAVAAGLGYVLTKDEREAANERAGGEGGKGWYATAYDRVTDEDARGRVKEFQGPFSDKKKAVSARRSLAKQGWKGKGVRLTVAFRQTSPF